MGTIPAKTGVARVMAANEVLPGPAHQVNKGKTLWWSKVLWSLESWTNYLGTFILVAWPSDPLRNSKKSKISTLSTIPYSPWMTWNSGALLLLSTQLNWLIRHPLKSDTCAFLHINMRKHPQEMLKIGVIWESHSPWASAVVLVRKKMVDCAFVLICSNWMHAPWKTFIACPILMRHWIVWMGPRFLHLSILRAGTGRASGWS